MSKKETTNEEFNELYKQLTPENKRKVIEKYFELLAEQAQDNQAANVEYFYFFDCLDGGLSDRYMTAADLNKLVNGIEEPMKEKDIIKIAANYEATLYRYTMDSAGNPQNERLIYDPFDM